MTAETLATAPPNRRQRRGGIARSPFGADIAALVHQDHGKRLPFNKVVRRVFGSGRAAAAVRTACTHVAVSTCELQRERPRRSAQVDRRVLEFLLRVLNTFLRQAGTKHWRTGQLNTAGEPNRGAWFGKEYDLVWVKDAGVWKRKRRYRPARKALGLSAEILVGPQALRRYLVSMREAKILCHTRPRTDAADAVRTKDGEYTYRQIWWNGELPPTVRSRLEKFYGVPVAAPRPRPERETAPESYVRELAPRSQAPPTDPGDPMGIRDLIAEHLRDYDGP